MISINTTTCLGAQCAHCVNICLARVFEIQDTAIVPSRPDKCYLCGHCLALCPTNSIVHQSFGKEFSPIAKLPSSEDLFATIQARRSIRHYKETVIPPEILTIVLKAGHYIPTAKNARTLEFAIYQGEAVTKLGNAVITSYRRWITLLHRPFIGFASRLVRKRRYYLQSKAILPTMEGLVRQWDKSRDLIFYHAPIIIVIHGPPTSFSEADANLAVAQMMLQAVTLGLGTCYIGYYVAASRLDSRILTTCDIPLHHRVYAAFTLGYPQYHFKRIIPRPEFKVTYHQ